MNSQSLRFCTNCTKALGPLDSTSRLAPQRQPGNLTQRPPKFKMCRQAESEGEERRGGPEVRPFGQYTPERRRRGERREENGRPHGDHIYMRECGVLRMMRQSTSTKMPRQVGLRAVGATLIASLTRAPGSDLSRQLTEQ